MQDPGLAAWDMKRKQTYPHPVWTFCPETEALETETNASLTIAVCVRFFIAFLQIGKDEKKESKRVR